MQQQDNNHGMVLFPKPHPDFKKDKNAVEFYLDRIPVISPCPITEGNYEKFLKLHENHHFLLGLHKLIRTSLLTRLGVNDSVCKKINTWCRKYQVNEAQRRKREKTRKLAEQEKNK
jgi:hypothetical protein